MIHYQNNQNVLKKSIHNQRCLALNKRFQGTASLISALFIVFTGDEGKMAHRHIESSQDGMPRLFAPGSMASTAF